MRNVEQCGQRPSSRFRRKDAARDNLASVLADQARTSIVCSKNSVPNTYLNVNRNVSIHEAL